MLPSDSIQTLLQEFAEAAGSDDVDFVVRYEETDTATAFVSDLEGVGFICCLFDCSLHVCLCLLDSALDVHLCLFHCSPHVCLRLFDCSLHVRFCLFNCSLHVCL